MRNFAATKNEKYTPGGNETSISNNVKKHGVSVDNVHMPCGNRKLD